MDIAFIHADHPDADGTGATHSSSLIIQALRERGHDVTTYCASAPSGNTHDHEILDAEGFPPHTGTRLTRAIRQRAGEFDAYDVVHSYITATLSAMHAIDTDAQTVLTLNSYAGVCPKNDLRYMDDHQCETNGWLRCARCSIATSGGHADRGRIYRSLSRLGNLRLLQQVSPHSVDIDGFHGLSSHVKETYEQFGFPGDRIEVVPNILDERFLVEHCSDFAEPYDLLYVGYLKPHKGVDRLPAVMEALGARTDREYRLTIVGEGGLRSQLEADVRRRGVDDRVEFRGYVPNDELPAVYASHDLFVYPGVWNEPFGRIFLEALAAGTPVVGTDVGAVAEIVGDAGRVTESNQDALVAGIEAATSGTTLRSYAEATRESVESYRPDKVVGQFERFYESVVTG